MNKQPRMVTVRGRFKGALIRAGDWQGHENCSAHAFLRLHTHFSTELADSFAYTAQTHAGAAGLNSREILCRDPSASVSHLDHHFAILAGDPDLRRLAARVAMNIGQALLYHAKYRQFHVPGRPLKLLMNI